VIFRLNQSFGKLALWGEGFADEQLDVMMSESPEVGNATLRFLNALASVLRRGMLVHALILQEQPFDR
jgi:hypothetical protein